jgi:hypothetical protein
MQMRAHWDCKIVGLYCWLHRQDECTGSASAEPGWSAVATGSYPLANRFDEPDTLYSTVVSCPANTMG